MLFPSSVVWTDLLDVVADAVACTIQNWQRTRRYEGILAVRREGFTEDWGDRGSAATAAPEVEDDDEADDDDDDDEPLQLVQYRIAWTEQLMLKIISVPFRVVNSRYNCTEVTGALPQVRDGNILVGHDDDIAAHLLSRLKKKKKLPAARGIRTPGDKNNDNNAAAQEQQQERIAAALAAVGDTSFWSVRQRRDAAYLTDCLQDHLIPALHILRYHHSDHHHHDHSSRHDEWEQVVKATQYNYCLAALQMWTEQRVVVFGSTTGRRRRTMSNRPEDEAEQVLQEMRRGYQLLEDQLVESATAYLLGTDTPTYIDCLVWGHLMEALTNRHVVTTVFFVSSVDDTDNDSSSSSRCLYHHCRYPALLAMAQTIYTRYHFDAATGPLPEWNVEENAANAFFGGGGGGGSDYYRRNLFGNGNRGGGDYYFANETYQERQSPQPELQQQQRPAPPPSSPPPHRPNDRPDPFETWHRWRRGGSLFPIAAAAQRRRTEQPVGTTTDAAAAAAATTKFHDDVWLMSVVTATVVLVLSVGFQETNTSTATATTAQ